MAKKKDAKIEQSDVKLSLKDRALQLKAQLNKGKDDVLVQVYSEDEAEEQLRVSSGVPKLDRILGGGPNGYGWPRGKLSGIAGPYSSGKSTLTITTIAEFQKIGLCALVDTENSYDPAYAEKLGVKIDELLVMNPTYSEQAFDTVFSLIESDDVRLVVIDTLDYLQPLVVINAESTDQFMGGAAKANNRFIARLIELCRKHDCTAIIVSQIRQKVGFVMGCVHAETLVNFVDGKSIPIKEVVDNKIKGPVWSYNEESCEFEAKEIVGWHHNGFVEKNEDYIHFETNSIESGNIFGFTLTTDHEVMTDKGFKKSKELVVGDNIKTKYKSQFNSTLKDFLNGIMVGDSHLANNGPNTALKLQDYNDPEYVKWKVEKLSKFYNFIETNYVNNGKTLKKYTSNYSHEFTKLKDMYQDRDTLEMFRNFSWLSLALLICDDGTYDGSVSHSRYTISFKRFAEDKNKMQLILNEFTQLGLNCKIVEKDGSITFDKASTNFIAENICKFIPKCMERKLPLEFRDRYEDFELESKPEYKDCYVQIKKIRNASDRQMRSKGKYDISVKDNHNYMVGGISNGVVIHNSTETIGGGTSINYGPHVRLDIRKNEVLKDKSGNEYGQVVKLKTVKNKTSIPQKTTYAQIVWGEGFDKIADYLDIAVEDGVVNKAGAGWLSYGDIKVQGSDNMLEKLRTDEKLLNEIKKKIGM